MTRSWPMFAGLREGRNGPEYTEFWADPHSVHFSGYDVAHPVILVEDPQGDLLGWLDNPEHDHADPDIAMVQHHKIFEIQFAYGSQASVDRGHGVVVPLRVEPDRTKGSHHA